MPAAESRTHSLTARTSWLVIGKTVAFAFTIAIPMLLVRRMPQHEFGLYKQIFLIINSAVTLLPLGFGMSAFYFLPRDERHRAHTVFNIVWITTAVAALFAATLLLFPGLLVRLFKEPEAMAFSPWIAVLSVLLVVGSLIEVVIVANEEIRLAAVVMLLIQISRVILMTGAAALSGTIHAVLVAATAQGIVQVVALLVYVSSRFPGFWSAFDGAFLRRQIGYALPFTVAGVLYSLETDLHNYFVSNRFGAATYAIYSIGCFQLPLFAILAQSVGSVMIPRFSALQREGNLREIVFLTARAMRKLSLVYFPGYAFLLVMRREFISALFTDRYLASVPIFAWNLTLIPFGIFVLDPVFRAFSEHRHFQMKLHAVMLACFAVLLPLAVARFGLVGAIAVVVVLACVSLVAGLVKVIAILDVGVTDIHLLTDVGRVGFAAVTAAVATAFARPLTLGLPPLVALAVCGVCFGVVYAAAVAAAGVVSADERALLANYIRRFTGRWRRPLEPTAVAVGDRVGG